MRLDPARIGALAAAALLLVPLSACSGSTVKKSCNGNRCEVTVKSSSSTQTKLFKPERTVYFSNLADDKIDVREGGTTRTIKEGGSETVGRVRVEVKDADVGEAHLVITRS
ncbi:hypothetical protein GCM10010399_16380 [Dactylosporangium fulvum]|uniref:Uncharacterized protein n=1 Tax=Dactylosporangium fulvum TaxID=53359 RepID=A0ABY5VYB6_9ACTN|nr:hypothetical protein [Dactylosporangium fulvum]UWP82713.1 hypothetical protein Dfulv_48140 [Dactylosporangium fulvum]